MYIKNINDNTPKLIYTHTYKPEQSSFMAYFPIGWSKNDKKLILEYGNPTNIGRGSGPEYNWATLDIASSKIENLSPSTPEFIDNNLFAIYAENSPKSPTFCGPSNGNSGKIVKKNIETRVTKTLVEEPNTFYMNLSVSGTLLNYKSSPNTIINEENNCGNMDWFGVKNGSVNL